MSNWIYSGKMALRGIVLLTILSSCGGGSGTEKSNVISDSIKTVNASVDETYLPVFNQEVQMFHYHNPKLQLHVEYKPEREAINDLIQDKVKIAVVSRPANGPEKQKLNYDGKVVIHETLMGYDAMVLVVNKENPVQKMSMEQVKKMLTGEINNWKQLGGKDQEIVIVFDNPSSGTVRYILDSLIAGKTLPKNVFSAKENPEVLHYVGETPQAIGFIGQAWVSDKDSPNVQEFLKTVEKVALKAEGAPEKEDQYFLPFQTEIKLGQYPLARRIYCLNRESSHGPGTDFVYFFAGDVGQNILLKAGLLPQFMQPRIISFKQEK